MLWISPTKKEGFGRRALLGSAALLLGWGIGFGGINNGAHAAPDGGVVSGGSIVIDQSIATTTVIHQASDRGIIDWRSFDVNTNELVEFKQPSAQSITVNRVKNSTNTQSKTTINGTIKANGNVVILNENGVLFGKDSKVDVGGLVASTSNLSDDAEFMAGGAVRFKAGANPNATIENQGQITARESGLVGLVAPQIENKGLIAARLGRVQLAAGNIATIDFAGDGLIQLDISSAVTKQMIKNSGTLSTDGGTVLLTASTARKIVDGVISNTGRIRSHTVVATNVTGRKGRVQINGGVASVQNTGVIETKGPAPLHGGDIEINGEFVALGGEINADGATGGTINITAGTLSLADKIYARGLVTKGGTVRLMSQRTSETSTSRIDVGGYVDGGAITHFVEREIMSSGIYSANGATGNGGLIDVSALSTKFLSGKFYANGFQNGGRIRLGGEYQGGKNLAVDEIPNAKYLILDKGSVVSADSSGWVGNGGQVILWSDKETINIGKIYARGGAVAGNGGFVEISSGDTLKYNGQVTTGRGPKGNFRAGSVLLDPKNILISDFAFNSSAIIMGYGFGGGRTNQNTNLDSSDNLGNSVSIDGNRLAVGAPNDDGNANVGTNTGAVYLFSFTDASFTGGVLEAILGSGYTGGKNIDVTLDASDSFGTGVSLDGNRLAVGAYRDDGSANSSGDSGAVYLYTFTDSVFSGGALAAQIGRNYTGGNNFNVTNMASNDYFGTSVSLNGNRLAVGAVGDDGFTNAVSSSGAVYLFSFADASFSTPTLQAILGSGYTGGKNMNIALDALDQFGNGVSIDGNQLVVGAPLDDGLANSLTNAGAAYLFNFTDAAFTGGILQSTIGYGYTGGKNVNFSGLRTGDQFGGSVSLDANRFAIGAVYDDGYLGNLSNDYGVVYLFSADDAAYTNIIAQAKIGYQYNNNAKDFDLNGLGIGGADYFGSGVSLDGNRLAVGAIGDDGLTNTVSGAGAVYLFTFGDSLFGTTTLQGIIGSGYLQGKNVNVPTLTDNDNNIGTSVSISGTKLAIGNYIDDGFNSRRAGAGSVYLYSFADTSYNTGVLSAIIGDGYIGGNNYNQALHLNDNFGVSVSLDGNRLAVGAYNDDGFLINAGNSGVVYLYSFADAVFSGITLESRIGYGYTGGKNIDASATLGGNDQFGYSVALSGNRLAVGAIGDDGVGNILSNSGAVYLYTFADAAFNGGALQAIIGTSYTGGKNINNTLLDASDTFGYSVALDGNRLAVGTPNDDGFGNANANSGIVYLYNFTDAAFSGGTLSSQVGNGYVGGKNLNIANAVNDFFGASVGLSGNHLFVGANGDDGFANAVGDSGAVFRFSFTDALFSGGALAGSIGARYIGTNDYDARGYVTGSDSFGRSLSVDGQNLVIGAVLDDGFGNNANDSGAVYLFRYTDLTYATPVLAGVVGAGYDLSILNKSITTVNAKDADQFGNAVSIDGNRMVIGAPRDDGFNDVGTDRGAVYLYSFTDSSFSGGVLEGIIGQGYTGGKNINITLGNSDYFGSSVSLDGNRLAVGAYADDGLANAVADSGAVYLYTFTDSVFSGGALAATIGKNYTGGKNYNLSLDASDYFGWAVSLDGNRLAVGAQRDDGSANALGDAGAVYLFTFTDAAFSGAALAATIGNTYTGGKNISATTLEASDYFGSAVSLDGNRLIVGAPLDDGNANARSNSGAVYYYTFSDAAFTGGTLQGRAGYNYTGGKNINVSTLEVNDWYGASASLNGNRMAVGIEQDDGFNNQMADSGAVMLYTFSDAVFSGGALQSTIGYRYTGGKNYDLGANFISEIADRYSMVALDSTRLLIGGYADDGNSNSAPLGNVGAVAMFTFGDTVFSTPTFVGMAGNGYTGGRNISFAPSYYQVSDNFGYAVSHNANRLAVGVPNDDGFGDIYVGSGAVYLYSILGGDYDVITLEGIIGAGYTGGKNIDMAAYLDRNDFFGSAVSLDGNRLAVGAYQDDGANNGNGNAGAVYLFSFSDAVFSGGVLQSRIGSGYTGGKNVNQALDTTDYFGWSVSLDGNRLAIGAQRDDGNGNARTDSGAVYLYSFADSVFSTPVLEGRIGYNYTGGKNVNLALDTSDYFGTSVALDGNRVAIGAVNDDGVANGVGNAGAVYLFSFANSTFTTPTLQGVIGSGYTGGKNVNITSLFTSDAIGASLALDGTVLAIGSVNDHGFNLDAGGRYGAIFIYTFSDLLFSAANYDSAIGNGYTGGKNINITLGGNMGNAVSLDSGTLITGASGLNDATNNFAGTGRVYIWRDSLSPISSGTSFATLGGSTVGITAASIAGLLSSGQNVTLQASNDITIASSLFVNNGSGNGGILTLQAGRSILINAAVVTDDADINFYANENLSTGLVNTQRDPGAATIIMGSNGSIDAGTGTVTFRIDAGTGKTNLLAGGMTLDAITADRVLALSSTELGNITLNDVITANGAGDAIILDAGANFINNYGAGALNTPSGRWLIYSDHSDYTTLNGLTPAFAPYNCVYGGACSIVVPGAGNGVLYQYGTHLLTVTVNTSRAYGTANPTLAALQALYTYTGFVGADDVSVLDVLPTATIAGTASAGANAGSTHVITFSGGSDNFYDYYFIDGLMTINKKDITAVWTNALTKTYGDFNPSVNTTSFTYTGLANAENNSVITANANFGTVDNTTGAGVYSIGATFVTANYNITNTPLSTITILKRDITAAWTGGLTKTYGDANPVVTTANFNYTGLVNGDLGAVLTPTANFGALDNTSNAGTYTGGVSATFSAANYNVTNTPAANLVINKRDVTATVASKSRIYGDANPSWAKASDILYTNLVNGDVAGGMDTVSFTAPALSATTNVGTTQSITITGFTDNNYNLTGTTAGVLSITKRDITGVVGSASRAYGDANPTWNWSNITWSNLANSETGSVLDALTISAPTAINTSNAGTHHAINISGFSDNNYNLTGFTAGTLTINKRDITAAVASKSRAYGDANPVWSLGDITFTNLANSETSSVIDTIGWTMPALTVLSNAGSTETIAVTSFADNNYNLVSSTSGTLSVIKRDITAVIDDASRAYGAGNPLYTWTNVTWSNLANSETGAVLDSVSFAMPGATPTANAGTSHTIFISGFSDNNYNLLGQTAGTLSITKAMLTVTAQGASKIYGDANPLFNVVYTGFANSETASVIDTLANISSAATTTSNAGTTHAIVASGASDGNYDFTYVDGVLSITKRDITGVVGSASRAYGDANPSWNWSNVTWSNLANSETGFVLDALTISAPTAINTSNAGTHHAINISGFSDNNYNLTGFTAGNLDINQAILTIAADPVTRRQGEVNPLLTYSVLGLKNGESADAMVTGVMVSTTANQITLMGDYVISVSGGVAQANYQIGSYVDGTITVMQPNYVPPTVERAVQDQTMNGNGGNNVGGGALSPVRSSGPQMDVNAGPSPSVAPAKNIVIMDEDEIKIISSNSETGTEINRNALIIVSKELLSQLDRRPAYRRVHGWDI